MSSSSSSSSGDDATDATAHGRIIAAAMDCILERGFYRASSNEIARRAGMTWGAIQYYFGTREKLMLAALEDFNREFGTMLQAALHAADVSAGTTQDRMTKLAELLGRQYGRPAYLAALQIVLNLAHNPETSQEAAAALMQFDARLSVHVTGLISAAIGPQADADSIALVFHACRGLAVSRLISDETNPRELVEARRTTGRPRDTHRMAQALAGLIDGASY